LRRSEEPHVSGIVASLRRGIGNDLDQVIVNDIPVTWRGIALDSTNPPHDAHRQTGFLEDFADDGVLGGFPGLNATARQRPLALGRRVPALDEQKPASAVDACGTDTWDVHQLRVL
jgi:hypothetical protein